MKDRIPGAPGQFRGVIFSEELEKMQASEPFAITLTRDDKPVEEGTPYNKASVLPDALAEKLCPGMENPAPKDALESLWQQNFCLTQAVGNTEQAFSVPFEIAYQNMFIDGSGWHFEQEGYTLYKVYFDFVGQRNAHLMGKSLMIRTYAHGTMRYAFTQDGDAVHTYGQLNPGADIEANPQSGVCEVEIPIPAQPWGQYEGFLYVSFQKNPYTEFAVWEKKEPLWNEMKHLQEASLVASGFVGDWYYRKWGDGFGECWYTGSMQVERMSNTNVAVVNLALPFPFSFYRQRDVLVQFADSNFAKLDCVYASETDVMLQASMLVEEYNMLSFSVYISGRWK